MQKTIYLCLLCICFNVYAQAQQFQTSSILDLQVKAGSQLLIPDPEKIAPPRIYPPVFVSEDGDILLFKWERLKAPEKYSLEYEFLLMHGEKVIFSWITADNQLQYGQGFPSLVKDETYLVIVNTRVFSPEKSYIVRGNSNGVSFTYIPECSAPNGVQVVNIRQNSFGLSWNGRAASPGDLEYLVRYRLSGKKEAWQEIKILEGASALVQGIKPSANYEVEVKKICFWRDGSEVHSEWVPVSANTISAKVPLPPFQCGDSFTYPSYPCTSNDQIDSLADLSVIYIGGIPVEVETISNHLDPENQMVWSGAGIASLPFGNKAVRVEWENVKINTDSNICAGVVLGIADDPMYYPDLDPGPIAFGGEICVPPPSAPGFDSNGIHNVTGLPWDEHGFGPGGTYDKQPPYPGYQPGAPYDTTGQYDPNGFDSSGYHAQTGTLFNPNGCNREGFTINGDTCDPNIPPYSWMDPGNSNPPTQAGLQYADEIKDSIGIWIQDILNEMKDGYETKRDSQQSVCGDIRVEMEDLLGNLDLSREFIFGAGDVYFEEGMHEHFNGEPQKMLNDIVRNEDVKDLEIKHIDLYHCDKQQYVYQHFMDIIDDFLGSGLNELIESIMDKIRSLPQSKIDQFINQPASFEEWLAGEVEKAVNLEYSQQYGSIGHIDKNLRNLPFFSPSARPNTYNHALMAANLEGELGHLLIAQALETRPEDIAFEYKQGFRLVNGVHRAFYMEAMLNARERNVWTTAHDSLLMPIDITNRGSDGKRYSVYLDNIKFYTFKATLDAYIIIETPFDGQKLVFEALDVLFTPKGPVVNPIKIELADDIWIRLNNSARLKLIGGPNTYAAFDCGGFAGLGAEADIELCRDVVLPYDPPTDEILDDPKRVSGHFQIYLPTFSQFFVEFSMDPFAIPQYEDVKWIISGVALDMTETLSPAGAPPPGYNTPFANQTGFRPMWKGFYIDSLLVRLPKNFSSDSTPVTVGVQDLVIDNMGVSASVTASDILSLSQGNAGGWAFSIDQFELTVLMNQFGRAQFEGNVHVPIFRASANDSGTLAPEDCMSYNARIDPGNLYSFELLPFNEDYAVDIWKAGQVLINPASSILMEYHNGDFTTIATLSGSVEVNGELLSNVDVQIPSIAFEGVEISNKAPYFSPGHWDFPNQIGAKFAGFELAFKDIGMVAMGNNDPALHFNVYINITDDTTKLKAGGGFNIVGELVDDNGRQRWKYKNFTVDELHISGGFPGVRHIEGYAVFYENDATYGTGFRGALAAEFDLIESSIQVVGQFGRMPQGYKYFLIDALYCGDIPMAGALSIKGIGGGVYYHMNRPDSLFGLPACAGSISIPTQVGASLSGIVYTPDQSKGIGFKLTVAVGLTSAERAFNANATFEVLFYDGGGLDRMWLYGNAKFMSDLNLSGLPTFVQGAAPNNDAVIGANFRLDLEFGPNGKLDGQLEVYANVAGILRGSGPGDKVVDASIHIAPGKWHIKIGSPSQRTGLNLTIPGFGTLAQVQSYFQIGTDIEDIPPLPEDIRKLTGGGGVSPGIRDLSVTQGKGFCFGSDIRLGSKNMTFLIFYAGLELRTGFDVSVLDYGSDVVCAGETEPIGINGWYAKGQIYASLIGKLGIKVKIFGSTKQFEILSMAAAASMEARLPNPFWAKASFGFDYNILNGLVSGHGDFDVEIGEQCQIQGEDPFKEVPVILSTNPSPGHKNVPVDTEPKVTFNFPIGQSFEFEDLNDNVTNYEITLDSVKLLWRGYEIFTEKVWQSPKHLILQPNTYLPGKDTLTLVVKVHVDSSGVTIDEEERIVTFITGPGLDYIPVYNVAGSYPLDGQYNFYKDQIADYKGYIQLRKGQPDIFFEKEDYIKVIRFRQPGGICTFLPVTFTADNYWEKRVEFDIPAGFLQNEQMYEMQLLDFPKADPN